MGDPLKNQFHLNTNGACFLCLGQNESTPTVPQPSRSRLKSKCSLRQIFHHLNLEGKLPFDINNIPSSPPELVANVCQSCRQVVNQFNDSYRAFEIARMRLASCVGRIGEVMMITSSAEKDANELSQKIRRKLSKADFELLESLREETMKSCENEKSAANSWTPQVWVKQEIFDVEEGPSSPLICQGYPSQDEEDDDFGKAPELDLEGTLQNDKDITLDDDSFGAGNGDGDILNGILGDASATSTRRRVCVNVSVFSSSKPRKSPKKTKTKVTRPHSKSEGSTSFLSQTQLCRYCGVELRSKKTFYLHEARCHADELLLASKHPSVSGDLFKEIVENLLFPKFVDKTTCQACHKVFSDKHGSAMKNYVVMKRHLLSVHLEQLLEAMEELQRDPDIERKVENLKPTRKRRLSIDDCNLE